MKLQELTQLFICSPTRTKIDGEASTSWTYKSIAYMNMQQDFTELDRNSAGEIDYDSYKARTTDVYSLNKGDGVCLTDIRNSNNIKPTYIVVAISEIGRTTTYICKKYNGE